jgi:hypothetical protein
VLEVERLGDEIAVLSAHLEAATARLLDLIREFDASGGWNTGFLSCAARLSWRVGLDRGAARVSGRRRHGRHPRATGAGGRRHARTGAGRGPRDAVPTGALDGRRGRFRGNAHDGAAVGGRGCAWPVRSRGRRARFLGNGSAPRLRRDPRGDATRSRWPAHGARCADADDSAGVTARSTIAIAAAASRVVGFLSAKGITSGIGRKVGLPRSRTSSCSAVGTTARSTKRARRWTASRTGS